MSKFQQDLATLIPLLYRGCLSEPLKFQLTSSADYLLTLYYVYLFRHLLYSTSRQCRPTGYEPAELRRHKLNDYICIYRGASHHSRGLLHSYLFSLTTSEASDLHRLKAYTRSTIQHDLRNYFLVAASTTPKSYRPLGTSHYLPITRRQGTWLSCAAHLVILYSDGACIALVGRAGVEPAESKTPDLQPGPLPHTVYRPI